MGYTQQATANVDGLGAQTSHGTAGFHRRIEVVAKICRIEAVDRRPHQVLAAGGKEETVVRHRWPRSPAGGRDLTPCAPEKLMVRPSRSLVRFQFKFRACSHYFTRRDIRLGHVSRFGPGGEALVVGCTTPFNDTSRKGYDCGGWGN